jgi:hypothetical protein
MLFKAETHPKSFITALIKIRLQDPSSTDLVMETIYNGLDESIKNTQNQSRKKTKLAEMNTPSVG